MNRHIHTQTMSAREFNQNRSRARQAADRGPLTITDRGKPAYVLMRYEDYSQLVDRPPPARKASLLDALADPHATDDFDLMDYVPERRVEPVRDPFADEGTDIS